jgi:hypothetical protein
MVDVTAIVPGYTIISTRDSKEAKFKEAYEYQAIVARSITSGSGYCTSTILVLLQQELGISVLFK